MKFFIFNHHLKRILLGALVLALVFTLVSPYSMVALAQTETPDDPQPEESSSGEGGAASQDQPEQPLETGDDPAPVADEEETPSGEETEIPPAEEENEPPSGEETEMPPVDVESESPTDQDVEMPPDEIGQEQEDLTETVETLNELGAVVVDEEGEPLAMGSQAATEVLSASDPYFTRGGTTYYYLPATGDCTGYTNCTLAANPVQAALGDLLANGLPDDGMLNVEAGTYDGFEVTGFNNPAGGSLTVYSVDGVGAATFTDMISIYNNVGLDVTLSGINVFTNSTMGINVAANVDSDITLQDVDVQNDSGDGIVIVMNESNVTLNSVDSSENDGYGIVVVEDYGNVTLESVTANDNEDWGIYMDTIEGNVTLRDVTANSNGAWGVDLGNIIGNVSLENVQANLNGEDGVYVGFVEGDVNMAGVTANQNSWVGIFVEDVWEDVHLADIVTNQNTDAGLVVVGIDGSVDMSNVTAELNAGDGVGVAGVLENLSMKNITASENGISGIYVDEVYGDVTLRDVVANMNTEVGVELGTMAWIGGNVHMEDVIANQNQNGVLVISVLGDGGVSLKNVTAEGNDDLGVGVAIVVGNVYLKEVLASLNGTDGVYIDGVDGYVKLLDVIASENDGYGIYVEDAYGGVYSWDVIAENNVLDGFYVDTLGKTYVCFSQFNDNTGYGVNVSAENGLYMLGEATGNTAGDINLRDDTTFTTLIPKNCYPAVKVKKTTKPVYLQGDIIVDFRGLVCGNTAPQAMVMPGKFINSTTLPTAIEGLPDSGVVAVVRTRLPHCAPEGYTYTISFKLPGDSTADDYQALAWIEGEGWVELPTTVVDGRLVVEATTSGMFAFIQVASE